jgi:hypothetical protein
MLRKFSSLLIDLQTDLGDFTKASVEKGATITLTRLELTLPLEIQLIFEERGCVLLADVPRNRSEAGFKVTRSNLNVSFVSLQQKDLMVSPT